jgi:GntP family gluconate:H+ symporter
MDALWILAIGMALVVGGILLLRLHAFLALLLGAYVVAALTPNAQPPIERILREFGNTAGRLGILIALATIVGKCLLDSGGADRIVRTLLRRFGEKNAPLAFLISSFFLSMPVFFDTVFLLMIPLAKAMRLRTGRNYTLYVLSIIASGSIVHSLVPPAPGPLYVATQLNIHLEVMILAGMAVGAVCAACAWIYAHWINKRRDVPLRETEHASLADLQTIAARDDKDLPPFALAVAPIILPIVLVTTGAIIRSRLTGDLASATAIQRFFLTLGNANIALALSACLGLATLIRQGVRRQEAFSIAVGRALEQAGSIILIICAGGAFGGMLQQSGIGPRLHDLSATWRIGILPLAWAFCMIVRVAQGSSTVAMITAVGVVGGAANAVSLGFHPVWLALAIGCGSKPYPWMNDSGFWVITKMSGFTEKESLTIYSPMVSMMGVIGLIVVMIFAKLFPLI